MIRRHGLAWLPLVVAIIGCCQCAYPSAAEQASTQTRTATAATSSLASLFRTPPPRAGMSVYWIWFGPAVTREGIDRDLDNMSKAHIGGAVLLPIYPLSDNDPRAGIENLPFLSPGYLELLHYTAEQCRKKGIALDVTIGTGWPYGGSWITPEFGARMIRMRGSTESLKPGEELVARFGDRSVVSVPTGMMVKRPSVGGEGLVMDHYSRAALQRHLEVAGEKLWSAVKSPGIRSFWCDSLEVFDADWTPSIKFH